MKKALLFCFIALLISLNAVAQEYIPGQVCFNPIQIPSIPYFTIDNTGNYYNSYFNNSYYSGSPGDSSSCNTPSAAGFNNYLNGNDVIYSFTATDNIPITITLNPTTASSGLFIYNSCANIGVSCVAGVANSTTNPRIIILPVTSGQTYYILISSYLATTATQSIGYNLTVAKNTCNNFTATYAVVPDCNNGQQFYVSANITNMGSATSILAVSNQGGSSQTISTAGTIQFGPYPNGTNVTLNLQNVSDSNCFSNSPNLTSFCPATNNLCANAIPITCGSVEMQTTVGATSTGAPTFMCGTGPGSGGLWYKYIGTGDVTTFSLCGSAYNTRIQVFTGSCGTFTCVSGNDNFCNDQSKASIFSTLGTVYYVYVYGVLGSQGAFSLSTTCTTTPLAPENDDCQNAIAVSVNMDSSCTIVTTGTIYGATQSPQTHTCVNAGTLNDDIWFKFVATQSKHKIELKNIAGSTIDLNHHIYTSTNTNNPCNNLTLISCNSNSNLSYLQNFIPGQTYFIRIYSHGVEILQNTTFELCVSIPPPAPSNDNCQDAVIVPVNTDYTTILSIQGTVYGATPSSQTNSCSAVPPNNDVWYKFIATQAILNIELKNIVGSTTNLYMELLQSNNTTNSCSSISPYVSCTNSRFINTFNLEPGKTYFIRVFSSPSTTFETTTFDLSVAIPPPPPLNDNVTNALTLIVNSDDICTNYNSGTITSATYSTEPNIALNVCGYYKGDVWYKFVATSNEHTIDLLNIVGLAPNLKHSVHTYSTTFPHYPVLYCSTVNSYNAEFIVGTTYYIRVYSDSSIIAGYTNFDICVSSPSIPIAISTSQYTVPELIENVLINTACANISNISWSTGTNYSSVNGIGYFEKNGANFPFEAGIVLSTGNAVNIANQNLTDLSEGTTNWLGDLELDAIISPVFGNQLSTYNATKLEFNFITENNFVSFDYIFASEEYGAYQCSYGDSFAFLLTDIASGVTTNLAVIPGTNQLVSVLTIRNNLYNSSCVSVNPYFFGNYYGTYSSGYNDLVNTAKTPINFNGMTVPMTAFSAVIPNNLYKIKLVIADRIDTAVDSAVFLEGGSFALNNQCQNDIDLIAFVDNNNNGIKESTELAYTQGTFNYTVNNSTPASVNYSPSGVLYVPVENASDTFNFSYQVYPELANYFNCTTLHSNITLNPTGNNTYYFPITNTLPYNDVEVSLTATAGPNPGFSYSNKITYKNNGLTSASGTLTYEKNSALTINTSSQTGTVATTNGFTYAFSNLAPNETRTITIGLQTPTIPTVALGDLLTNTASATSAGDINPANNSTELAQIVTGSYDPNDKMEAQGPEILFSSFGADDYLYYTIRFQNTGTANAQTVVITDLLSADLDEQSIRMISASHDYTMNRIGNDLEWTFEAINLVPTIVNEAASQGYVHFKIKPKPGYMVGDIIPNTAQIYFDFNAPIITNTFETEFVATLGVADFTTDNLIVYPNPATNQVSISVQNSADAIAEIRLTDMLGKVVFQQKGTHTQTMIDLSGLSKGVYMLEVQTENKFSVVKKLVKN